VKKYLAEVVKEYVMDIEGIDFKIKGRITKSTDQEGHGDQFHWEISHYYKPSKGAASTYSPSLRTADSIQEVEAFLMAYMRGFTTFDITLNESY